jgi:hypothetical protein
MRIFVTILMTLVLISGCQTDKKKTLEGDLYFKLIDFQRFYDAPDSILTKIETSEKNVNKDTLTEQDKKIYALLEFLTDKQLLRKPFVRLRQDDGKIVMLFLDKMDYEKIKDYNHNDLVRDNKRIRINAEVSELKYDSFTAYENIKIISVDKIDGKTYWKK